ncbi:choice-of-anchor L domain-containing protein [Flavobacterium sp. DGU11]|uniref:Choice-of-anchor L domain-containing protein n=1 Tax=Flavobacterium arundinis TaxID=3139143 RepID=A0ABU9HWL3_9FLAO
MKFTTNIISGLPLALLLMFSSAALAQDPIQVVNNLTDEQLVNALVDNGCANISNIRISGSGGSAAQRSYSYFTSGTDFPFDSGIILSTGYAMESPGPNTEILSNGTDGWAGDSDLEEVLNISNTLNATIMEFDFVPATNHISFDYIFASEEYTSWGEQQWCDYSDGFAFLLKQAGSADPYQNLAVIPGTDTPVKVTTVRGQGFCPAANPEYFGAFNGSDSPTNYNGQTVVLTAESDVIAGTLYHIKLVIADQGDTLYDAAVFLKAKSFGSVVDLGENRMIANGNALCEGDALLLDASIPGATGYQWYRDGLPVAGATNALYSVTTAGAYSVKAQLTPTCYANGEIRIEYNLPIEDEPFFFNQCDDDDDGLTGFYLFRVGGELTRTRVEIMDINVISWHLTEAEAQTGENDLLGNGLMTPFYNTVPNQVVYARVQSDAGCIAIVATTLSTPSFSAPALAPIEVCDDNGLYTFNFTQLTADILATAPSGTWVHYFETYEDARSYSFAIQTPSSYTNTVSGGQTIYVGLTNLDGCVAIMPLQLIVHTFGEGLTDEELTLCADTSETLDAGSGFTSYSWDTDPVQTTSTITVDEPGIYTVTLTNTFGCEGSKTFTLTPSGRAKDATFEINDLTGNNNTVTVSPVGPGTYEYSIDGIDYQESPVFDQLTAGEYTIYIRDTKGCGPAYSERVFVLDYPAFFTPNGDGVNDTWRIPYSYNRPGIFVTVFDRYGKIIKGFNGYEQGWDGTYDGKPLPATDYWFLIELENGRQVRGHFAMLR